jgi:hypothetical protein
MNYFITDCKGEPVGNPKGYKTFRGASQQANSRRSKVYKEIWQRFYAAETAASKACKDFPRLVNSIKQQGA